MAIKTENLHMVLESNRNGRLRHKLGIQEGSGGSLGGSAVEHLLLAQGVSLERVGEGNLRVPRSD